MNQEKKKEEMGAQPTKYWAVINDKTQGGVNTFRYVCKLNEVPIIRIEKFCVTLIVPPRKMWILRMYCHKIQKCDEI